MILKLFASVFMLASSVFCGQIFKKRSDMHLKILENLSDCMRIFETEIRYTVCDIPDCSKKAALSAVGENKKILDLFCHNAESNSGIPLSKIWTDTIFTSCQNSIYTKDDIEMLSSFGLILGSGDSETQLKNIELFRLKINDAVSELKTEKAKKDSIYSKLFLYFGIAVIIIAF